MSRYPQFEVSKLRDYPLESRLSKVRVESFAKPTRKGSISEFLENLPGFLAAEQFKLLVARIRKAQTKGRAIIWGFGGHVVKVGLGPILVDLMQKGFATAFATNGSGAIHDFEIALAGHTSEDVEEQIGDGSFGMARETGKLLNQAIQKGQEVGKGLGESVGELLESLDLKHPEHSIFLQAYQRRIPVSVHVALGTDTIHFHPKASGKALGEGSLTDFRVFTHQVSKLDSGGVYLNIGSAVLLPEVFLKAVSLVRNSGRLLENFTTANFDFIQHYRPTQNVVRRPVQNSGLGIALTGHHEILIPLLAAALLHGPE